MSTELIGNYAISPLVRIDRPSAPEGPWTICAGHGSTRELLETRDQRLIKWLLERLSDRQPAESLASRAAADLGMSNGDGYKLIQVLVEAGILIDAQEADTLATAGERWEEWGWRDAFDFHFSVRSHPWDRQDRGTYEATLQAFLDDTSDSGPQPPTFKHYPPEFERIDLGPAIQQFELALPEKKSFKEALGKALPLNVFTKYGIDFGQTAKLLQIAHGVHFTRDLVLGEHLYRASPSGGARHPVEVYLAARKVNGLPPGIYHYEQGNNRLARIGGEQRLSLVDQTCFDKGGITSASAVLYVTYRFLRHAWKYRYSRTYRMVLMELGHNFQSTRIAASLVGLQVYYNPAINDALVSQMLSLPDDCEEGPMYAVGLGIGGQV